AVGNSTAIATWDLTTRTKRATFTGHSGFGFPDGVFFGWSVLGFLRCSGSRNRDLGRCGRSFAKDTAHTCARYMYHLFSRWQDDRLWSQRQFDPHLGCGPRHPERKRALLVVGSLSRWQIHGLRRWLEGSCVEYSDRTADRDTE